MDFPHEIYSDVLVIGSGLSGLNFALTLSKTNPELKITIVTKTSALEHSTTNLAQGGIASVFSLEDSFNAHVEDTKKAGAGLCDSEVVRNCVQEGPAAIKNLIDQGVQFTTTKADHTSPYDLTLEGGHSFRRIFHAADRTGQTIVNSLISQLKEQKNIHILFHSIAIDLVKDTETNTCQGAYFFHTKKKKVFPIEAKVTFLATGGASKVYKYTSNPDTNTGDGIAMAYRCGARVANMEFTQFHPTCLYHPQAKNSLLSEALRGEGAFLVNSKGERFMEKYHPQKELAPRDVVSLSIDKEMKRTGNECVYLDIRHKGTSFIRECFPHNYETCKKFGFDLTQEPIPVVPAAHYTCGGLMTNENGETNIGSLLAAGEVAHTGFHGANRLASNSLLESLVFSTRAAKTACSHIHHSQKKIPAWDHGFAQKGEEKIIIRHCWDEIRTLMWNYVGIVRTDRRLGYASRRLSLIAQEVQQNYWERYLSKNLIELRNIATIAQLIITSAQMRKESRGLHQNLDHPHTDPLFQKDTIL